MSTAVHQGIKRFVQDRLGCTCPEKVFGQIEYQQALGDFAERKIKIGGRLLIYLVNWAGGLLFPSSGAATAS